MKNLLALLGLLVVAFAGLGWYFGWYDFTVKRGSDGKMNVSGAVDVNKIRDDAGNFGDKVGNALRNANQPPPHPAGLMGPPMPPDNFPTVPTGKGGLTIPIEIKLPSPSGR